MQVYENRYIKDSKNTILSRDIVGRLIVSATNLDYIMMHFLTLLTTIRFPVSGKVIEKRYN
jgi:hypothetical protein